MNNVSINPSSYNNLGVKILLYQYIMCYPWLLWIIAKHKNKQRSSGGWLDVRACIYYNPILQ